MTPARRTRLAVRRRREANLVPIVISDDETPDGSLVASVHSPADVPGEEVVQPVLLVCPDCGIAGHHPDECQFVPSEDEEVLQLTEEDEEALQLSEEHEEALQLTEEDEEVLQLTEEDEEVFQPSEEDPSEQHDSSESDSEPEQAQQPAVPAGPAPPRCPICGMPGHVQQDCHTFVCYGCGEPRGRPHPLCFRCDPLLMFEFDGVCDRCLRAWATVGRYCAICDRIEIERRAALPPAGPSTPSFDLPERHAGFDLNLPPAEESTDED